MTNTQSPANPIVHLVDILLGAILLSCI